MTLGNAENNSPRRKVLVKMARAIVHARKALPWKTATVGDIANLSYGYTASASRSGDLRLIRITDITPDGELRDSGKKYVDRNALSEKYILSTGDILIARTGSYGRSMVFADNTLAVFASYLIRIRFPSDIVIPDFFGMYAQSDMYWKQVESLVRGGGQPQFNGGAIKKLIIPVPPLEIQRAVVEYISKFKEIVDDIRYANEFQINEILALENSIISESISSADSEIVLGDAIDEVQERVGDEWASYSVIGAGKNGILESKVVPGKQAHKYKIISSNTTFYNPMDVADNAIAFLSGENDPGIISPDYVALKGKHDIVDDLWFYHWMRSRHGGYTISQLVRGAVRKRMLFNRLAEGKVQLPTIEVQRKASAQLREVGLLKVKAEARLKDVKLLMTKCVSEVFDSEGRK